MFRRGINPKQIFADAAPFPKIHYTASHLEQIKNNRNNV